MGNVGEDLTEAEIENLKAQGDWAPFTIQHFTTQHYLDLNQAITDSLTEEAAQTDPEGEPRDRLP